MNTIDALAAAILSGALGILSVDAVLRVKAASECAAAQMTESAAVDRSCWQSSNPCFVPMLVRQLQMVFQFRVKIHVAIIGRFTAAGFCICAREMNMAPLPVGPRNRR
jgi:hypothetical protein